MKLEAVEEMYVLLMKRDKSIGGIVFMRIMPLPDEVECIRKEIERWHQIQVPEPQLICSDKIGNAFLCVPRQFPDQVPKELQSKQSEMTRKELIGRGLEEDELADLELTKPIIVLSSTYQHRPARFYGTLYEELGHEAAYVLGIVESSANEGFALAWRFKGLLESAKREKLSLIDAVNRIESDVRRLEHDVQFFSKLEGMGLKMPKTLPSKHYNRALSVVREYNPQLRFRDRDPDEIISELNSSIKYILKPSERMRKKWANLLKKMKSVVHPAGAVFF